jgi:hypothetical protein
MNIESKYPTQHWSPLDVKSNDAKNIHLSGLLSTTID